MTTAGGALEDKAPNAPMTAYQILIAISVGHMLNDTIQSLVPSIYPCLLYTSPSPRDS